MALVTVLYIVGTIIFNVYLRSLGIFEFELIQLRYIFVGLIFAIFTGIIVGIAYGLWILFRRFARSAQKEKKKTKKQKAKEATLLEIIFLLFLFPLISFAFITHICSSLLENNLPGLHSEPSRPQHSTVSLTQLQGKSPNHLLSVLLSPRRVRHTKIP